MKRWVALALLVTAGMSAWGQAEAKKTFFGMDRNTYPGDAQMKMLARQFAFTGYWLNTPPGAKTNSWHGHRAGVLKAGMGFAVLWNGRTFKQIGKRAAQLGREDARAAVRAAREDGFHEGTVIFLDQEEGGRLLQEQRAYLHAWVDGVTAAKFRAGVYASGIGATEGGGETIVTVEDIRKNAGARKIAFWVADDACPPAPGCVAEPKVKPSDSGVEFADIWQYSQSPMRPVAQACKQTYDVTTNCYAPGTKIDVDISVANSADPSGGRK